MAKGMTCYERDETLCEDQMCLRVGCRIRNDRLSAESKMPARIWLINGHVYSPTRRDESVPGIVYIRADIAEAMAEALAGLVEVNENHNKSISKVIGSPVGWKDDYLDAARSALTAYREASNDKA